MATQAVTSITCPNCRGPFTAPIQQIVDAQADPEAKSRLLGGQLNFIVCPHCGFRGALNAPFLYHDAELELALVHMPMDVGMTDVERQKTIGDLTNRLMQQLPPEARKGYLLQPRIFISQQGLIDAMLEQDQETRETLETQRRKMELFEQLRQIDPDDGLAMAEFVGANDKELDASFFQLLDLVTGIVENQGDTVEYDRLTKHQTTLLEKSSMGQSFKAQRAAAEALTANPTRETLLEQLIAAEDDKVREMLVMIGRQLLDYAFFQALTAKIDAAQAEGDTGTKDELVALRKQIMEIRDHIDAMTTAVMAARSEFLRDLMLADDPKELLTRRLDQIDDAFFSVLNTNIRQAELEGQQEAVKALRGISDVVLEVLHETAPPEIRLVGQLAAAEDDEQVRRLLEEQRESLNQDFVEFVERTAQDMEQVNRSENAERLRYAAERIKEMLTE